MKSGKHQDFEDFISMHSMKNQIFDMTGEYYRLHTYDLDSYDRRFAIIDVKEENLPLTTNSDFYVELYKRINLLKSQNFVFIKATPWESLNNITVNPEYPNVNVEHVKWSGGVSWFWFYMYKKHVGKSFNFTHDKKPFDFLYLNKLPRGHRQRLMEKIRHLMDNSIFTNWEEGKKLPPEYELPWAQQYPSHGMDQDIYEKPYNDTKYSLVSETNDVAGEVFMTEKIWKAIMAKHVFIVHGNYLYLQKLREMGFKTFSAFFDESYDLELHRGKKIEMIVDLCKDLLKKNWQDIYLQSQSIRQHNFELLFNKEKLSREINKTIDLFLEFADSSQISS